MKKLILSTVFMCIGLQGCSTMVGEVNQLSPNTFQTYYGLPAANKFCQKRNQHILVQSYGPAYIPDFGSAVDVVFHCFSNGKTIPSVVTYNKSK